MSDLWTLALDRPLPPAEAKALADRFRAALAKPQPVLVLMPGVKIERFERVQGRPTRAFLSRARSRAR